MLTGRTKLTQDKTLQKGFKCYYIQKHIERFQTNTPTFVKHVVDTNKPAFTNCNSYRCQYKSMFTSQISI